MEAKKTVKYSSFMNISYKDKLAGFAYYFLIALYFTILLYCLHLFSWSDQYFYRLFYDGLYLRNLPEAYNLFARIVGAREPGYFILAYISHFIMPKYIFDILLSCSVFSVLLFYFHRTKCPKVIVTFLITGVYFLVTFFITERLKLGLIFLLLYFLFSKNRYSLIFVLMAILTHAQLLILLPFLYIYSGIKINSKKAVFLLLFVSAIVGGALFQHLAHKLPIYFQRYSFFNIIKPLIFAIITVFFVKKDYWKQYYSFFIPVILVALFFGDGRMTSFAFLGSLYFWAIERKMTIWSLPLFLSCIYFSLRGLVVLLSSIIYGDGYGMTIMDFVKMIKQ